MRAIRNALALAAALLLTLGATARAPEAAPDNGTERCHARSEFNAPCVGTDRAYTAARLKSLVDAGVPTALHADTPVAPPRPLELVWIAVNRFGLSGKVRGPEERVSVHQALRMVTIDAAFSLGVEDKVGSIVTGKFADFAVLEQDPYAVPKEKIRDIKVWGTVVGGRVFPASEIRPQ